jgi:hypothetical protein
MRIDWTTVFASGITASVICTFQFFTTRYLGRMLDHIEKRIGITTGNGINGINKPKDGKQ